MRAVAAALLVALLAGCATPGRFKDGEMVAHKLEPERQLLVLQKRCNLLGACEYLVKWSPRAGRYYEDWVREVELEPYPR